MQENEIQSQFKSDNDEQKVIIVEKVCKIDGDMSIKKYERGKLLGKGGFSMCYEVTNIESKKCYAAKIISKAILQKNKNRQKLLSEISIHKSLKHKHIVDFQNVFEDKENVYILLEICQNQTLNEVLKEKKRLSELEVQKYAVQILMALKYLAQFRIIHRDLKLNNLFLNDKFEIKLGDFGLCTKLQFDGEKKRTICGTPNYMAPEILDDKIGHSYEVDIWSLGIIIYTLLIGQKPFESPNVKTIYKQIQYGAYSFPEDIPISESAKDLILKLLVQEPAKRLKLDEILSHKFFYKGGGFINKCLNLLTLNFSLIKKQKKQIQTKLNNLKKQSITVYLDENQQRNFKNEIFIKKWSDFSSKYGIGYILSNGQIGVLFNDQSKIINDSQNNYFNYIELKPKQQQDNLNQYQINQYNQESYPQSLKKKVTLLQYFKEYLDYKSNKNKKEDDDNQNLVYLKQWKQTKNAIIFRLSNSLFQCCFSDKTEIILSLEHKKFTFVDLTQQRLDYDLSTAQESSNTEMTYRLKIFKDIIKDMVIFKLQKLIQRKTFYIEL